MSDTDLYADLGLSPDATPDQIKAAYRQRAKGAHPDAGGSAEAFEKVRRAFVVLSDPDRRSNYDQTGDADDSVNNDLARVATVLSQKLTASIEKAKASDAGIAGADVVQMMRAAIKSDLARMVMLTAQSKRSADKARDAIKRVRFTGTGPNLLRSILEQQLAEIEREARTITLQSEIHQKALDQLDHYGWDFDDPFAAWPEEVRPRELQKPASFR